MIVDRDPWALELHRLSDGKLKLVGRSTPEEPAVLSSEVVPLTWQLLPGEKRAEIAVAHCEGTQKWRI